MKTLGNILSLSTKFLEENNINKPRLSAEEIIAYVLGCKRLDLYLLFDKPMEEVELEKIRQLLKRRCKNEPIEYIKGKVEFYNCSIEVSKDVLIPRKETEQLVDLVKEKLLNENLENKILWDVCCGSGCIGIALKKLFPKVKVVLSDICPLAMDVARRNSEINNVDVDLIKSDCIENIPGTCHFLVSNPPYVTEDEYLSLDDEVISYEPKKALIGGTNGLDVYEKLAFEIKNKFIGVKYKLFFEIGESLGLDIQNIFFKYLKIKGNIIKDWSNKDRFFFLENE